MKVIIAGTRTITSYKAVLDAIRESGFEITEVVSGCCRGVDTLGELYASIHKIPVVRFPANWKEHGNYAGLLRNQEMANYGDCLIALWDSKSAGTRDMISRMNTRKKPVYVKTVSP